MCVRFRCAICLIIPKPDLEQNNDAVTSINTWIDADDGPSESKKHTILKLLQGIAQASLSKNKIMVPVLRLVMSLLRMSNNQPSDETVDLYVCPNCPVAGD